MKRRPAAEKKPKTKLQAASKTAPKKAARAAPKKMPAPARKDTPPAAPSPRVSPNEPARPDGRLLRGQRARTTLLDAVEALLAAGNYMPSMQQIAEQAGVSRRLVFHHFADTQAIFEAALRRQVGAISELIAPIPESLPLATRVTMLIDQRARIYEALRPIRRAALCHEYTFPALAASVDMYRNLERAQVEVVFAPEIRSCPDSSQRELSAALGCAASFSTWESLRSHQRLGIDDARRALLHLLTGLLRLTPTGASLVVLH